MNKEQIKSAIQQFSHGNLTENALNLFKALGYNTERQAPLDRPDYATFKENYINPSSRFDEKKALVSDWRHIDLLFQLSKEEVLKQTSLFDTRRVDNAVIESYLFFAVELNDSIETQDFASLQRRRQYTRTELSNITREINRLFPMPVMILFKHGETITLSVIDRRPNKQDSNKDVLLKKVSLIKDINIENPHRAHVEILFQFAFPQLLAKYGAISTMDGLYKAFIKVLDPACGSGAFPMGMLHRIVGILKKVDPGNDLWLEKQLSKIEDGFQRENFAKILKQHLEDYPRKLGIIKNAIYGIDNQPLAVLITKLRFFISLLIEQKIDKSLPQENYLITPLPNIETKVICADSLMDVEISIFNESAFTHLRNAKESYYKPNLSREEKAAIATDVAEGENWFARRYPKLAKAQNRRAAMGAE